MLETFVEQKREPELFGKSLFCPFCGSAKAKIVATEETLLGWGGPPALDPNHTWEYSHCFDCSKDFVRESKKGNAWYTDKGRVLRGFPNCFESYEYIHVNCGGPVKRRNTERDGKTPAKVLTTAYVDGERVPEYRTFYDCGKCDATIETQEP